MQPGIRAGAAVPVTVEARHRIDGARLELSSEDVHAQPVTSQRPRRKRAVIAVRRTRISTTSAAQTPRIPQSPARAASSTAAQAQNAATIARVAGADQDAVEREDRAVERLHECEERPQERGLVEDRVVAGERLREHSGESEHHSGEGSASRDREPDHPLACCVGVVRSAASELPRDDDLPRDGERVEHQREEDEELERDLMRTDRRISEPGRHRTCEDERAHERARAQKDPLPERQHASGER